MKSAFAAAALLVLLALPAQAAGPLAPMVKQMVSQVVRDFVQSQASSLIRQSLGPCKSMLVDMGAGAAMGRLPAASGLLPGLLGAMPGMPARPATASPVDHAQALRQMETALAASGVDPASRAQIMQMLQGAPLSAAETDELVTRLVTLAKAVPDQTLPCSPEELKLVFTMTAAMPMASGPLRMMLEQFRALDRQFAETRAMFAQMSEAEQSEAVDLMLAEAASMSAEERKQLAGFLQSDLFGLPPPMRERLLSRLGNAR